MNAFLARWSTRRAVLAKRARRRIRAARRHVSPSRIRDSRALTGALSFPSGAVGDDRAHGGVWGVSMVRDEMELLPLVITHLEQQGVTGLVVADHGSTDGTREFLETYEGPLGLVVVVDSEPRFLQEHKMDLLARAAVARGAQWIVPFDADEFWYGMEGTLAEVLLRADATTPVQSAHVHNVVRTEHGLLVGSEADPLPKVAFRPHRWAHLAHGNHSVHRPGLIGQRLRVLHFPYRSEEHFMAKVRRGSRALGGPRGGQPVGHSWTDLDLLPDEELRAVYADMLSGSGPWYMDWIPRGTMQPLPSLPPREWPLD